MNIQQIIEIIEADSEAAKADFADQNCSFCAEHAPKVIRNKIIVDSLMKQKPVKIKSIFYGTDSNIVSGTCPSCNGFAVFELRKEKKSWCSSCGQALDWRC